MAISLLNFDINPNTGEVKLLPGFAGDKTPVEGLELVKLLANITEQGKTSHIFWHGDEKNPTWVCLYPPNALNPNYHLEFGEPGA